MVREHNRSVEQNALSLTTEALRNNFTIDYFNLNQDIDLTRDIILFQDIDGEQ